MSLPLTFLLPVTTLMTILTMVLQRKHLLMALLSLEAMILSITLIIASTLIKVSPSNIMMILIVLTFGASEASLGLACLINIVRFKGNDMLKSTSTTKC